MVSGRYLVFEYLVGRPGTGIELMVLRAEVIQFRVLAIDFVDFEPSGLQPRPRGSKYL